MKPRIMYIESKAESLNGAARIGRVTFSPTGKTIYYGGRSFQRFRGFKANHIAVDTREEYWISGPHKDGEDRLYVSNIPVEIDDDVREEYWTEIRNKPEFKARKQT
jgi:hypothetical protein